MNEDVSRWILLFMGVTGGRGLRGEGRGVITKVQARGAVQSGC